MIMQTIDYGGVTLRAALTWLAYPACVLLPFTWLLFNIDLDRPKMHIPFVLLSPFTAAIPLALCGGTTPEVAAFVGNFTGLHGKWQHTNARYNLVWENTLNIIHKPGPMLTPIPERACLPARHPKGRLADSRRAVTN